MKNPNMRVWSGKLYFYAFILRNILLGLFRCMGLNLIISVIFGAIFDRTICARVCNLVMNLQVSLLLVVCASHSCILPKRCLVNFF